MTSDDFFAALPAAFIAISILLTAIFIALIVQAAALRIGERVARGHPFASASLTRLRGPVRLALIVLALRIAMPLAPLPADALLYLTRGLQVAFVVLVGWMAMTAANIGADIYLRRFKLDVGDNLLARKHVTQTRILKGALDTLIVIITLAAALMSFDAVRQYGVSLFASAGVAGLVVGFAARPMLSNLMAGVQIAVTQPIRIDDVVIVEGEWGRIEEITATYVVVRIWDLRRLIVPLSYFIEKPFENWTRSSAKVLGTVHLHVDYTAPVERIREKLNEIVGGSALWDGETVGLQVTDTGPRTMELRALVSGANSSDVWNLRCDVREKLVAFLQQDHPQALPRGRADVTMRDSGLPRAGRAPAPAGAPEPSGGRS